MVKLNFLERYFFNRVLKKVFKDDPSPQIPEKPIDLRNPIEFITLAEHLRSLSEESLDRLYQLFEWRAMTEMASLDPKKATEKDVWYQSGRVSAFLSLRNVVKNTILQGYKEAEKIRKKFKKE